ncbi:MAG: hypothetical protein KDA96_02025, partial [Planctomycetaceae bacterium]|nr:hypothetical protein [Planctomycetaceae bacterium]
MLRPNLLSTAVAIALAVTTTTIASAQQFAPMATEHFGPIPPGYGPYPSGGYPAPHQPLIQLPRNGYQAPLIDYSVQQAPSVWDEERPIERFLTDLTKRSWVRFEFLLWNYERPGDNVVGTAPSDLTAPNPALQLFPNNTVE